MTVSYTHEVATGRGMGNFARLLFRWRGGVYNLVLPELFGYACIYAIISIIYRFVIKGHAVHQYAFDKLVKYCGDYAGVIPVSFVLGFYVSQIVTRWWNQFMTIPWPDTLAAAVGTTIEGNDERGRMMRRTIVRYANLSFVITMAFLSPQAKSRFPTMEHIVEAGFMLPHEKMIFDHLDKKKDYPKYWIPIIWAGNLTSRARKEGRITSDLAMITIITHLAKFRCGCGDLMGYDWVSIPLVYTQVVTLAVYLYFLAALVGKQFIEDEHELDLYVPIFLFLEFFFYMGWLKVAETMVNPFGEDDDDFEVNWLIDRNLKASYLIVDEMHQEHPEMMRDQYWDEIIPDELPYTEAAKKFQTVAHAGSAALAMGDNYEKDNQDIRFVDMKEGGIEGSMLSQGSSLRNPGSLLAGGPSRNRIPLNPRPSYAMDTSSLDPNVISSKRDESGRKIKPYNHLNEQGQTLPIKPASMKNVNDETDEDPPKKQKKNRKST